MGPPQTGSARTTHVVNGALYDLKYGLLTDFEPIALVVTNPMLIVARKGFPADNLKAFIIWLKANPDKASQGTSGVGSGPQVFGAFFQSATGTRIQSVPYRGLGPAMQDLVAGQIDVMIDSPSTSLPQVGAGTIKAYAVMAKSRLASAPDIPTADEAGLPGVYFSIWYGLWAPKGRAMPEIG